MEGKGQAMDTKGQGITGLAPGREGKEGRGSYPSPCTSKLIP